MKKSLPRLTGDDVRDILDDKLRESGLDQVPKRLNLLDKILISVDKLVGEIKGYREQQELNSSKLAYHDDRIEKIEKHLHVSVNP